MTIKFLLITFIFSIGIFAAACSRAGSFAELNVDSGGAAVRGYDTVAYFTDQAPTVGNPAISFTWKGAKWLFSSAENLEKFKSDPERYAPQFGGYCSYAVAHGYTADGDPEAWKIVDGKLFLNYSQKAKALWEQEEEKFIEDGRQNWAEFQKNKPEHKG